MIVISGALVLVALVLLVVGVTQDPSELNLVYGSIAVSLAAFVFLIIGVLQRRGQQPPAAAPAGQPAPGGVEAATGAGTEEREQPAEGSTAVIPAQEPVRVSRPTSLSKAPEPPVEQDELDEEDLELGGDVLVVPGRPRYHVDGCRYIADRDVEVIDVLDARDEGFTACGVCRPDEVLAEEAAAAEQDELEGDDLDADLEGDDLDDDLEDDQLDDEELEEAYADEVEVEEPVAASARSSRTARVPDDLPAGPADGPAEAPAPSRAAKKVAAGKGVTAATGATAAKAPAKAGKAAKAPAKAASAPSEAPSKAAVKAPAKAATKAPAKAPTKAPTKAPAQGSSSRAGAPVSTPFSSAAASAPGRTVAAKAAPSAPLTTPAAAPAKAPAGGKGRVVVIPDRGRFHQPDCRYVRGVEGTEELTRAQAAKQGYEACGVCKP